MQVLHGRTSPETAYLVDDYPYSFHLRCKIRYWLETAMKGAKSCQMRLMSQTTDARRDNAVWNKPKGSTYNDFAVMYLDENNHIQQACVSCNAGPEDFARFVNDGFYAQLDENELKRFRVVLVGSRVLSSESWKRWDTLVELIVLHGDNRTAVFYTMEQAGLHCWERECEAAEKLIAAKQFDALQVRKQQSRESNRVENSATV